VIEDDARWRTLLEIYLETEGYQVLVAADGLAGLALAAERPDFILCDVEMPRLDGYGVLAALQQQPELREIPFIFLTGRAERADQRKGMVHGADDYITKPFQAAELLEAITTVMQKRATLGSRWNQQADERRREFVAPWGHELLTPLNGILGAAFLLESEADSIGRPEVKELAASIRASAERQLALSHKLMHHFHLEQIRENRLRESTPTIYAGTSVEDEAQVVAKIAGRVPDLQASCEPALLRIGPEWLRVAVAELVENAFKFSRPGSPVTVIGQPDGSVYRLEITDSGPGMSAMERENVGSFCQFNRAEKEQQGLGLGLSITRRIVQLHGGSFALSPGPDGVGLRVVIALPLGQ
jgi:signal transduction histidine kinase